MPGTPILGLVLAGGLARRMGGGDKTRIHIGGKTILERVLARLKPQCTAVILNANGDPARFADTGLPVIADTVAVHACRRRVVRPACRLPARAPANGATPWSACGRWRCGRTCARRCSRKTCARSRAGLRAMALRSRIGRQRRSIRSSTLILLPTPRRRNVLQSSNATFERLIAVALKSI